MEALFCFSERGQYRPSSCDKMQENLDLHGHRRAEGYGLECNAIAPPLVAHVYPPPVQTLITN